MLMEMGGARECCDPISSRVGCQAAGKPGVAGPTPNANPNPGLNP